MVVYKFCLPKEKPTSGLTLDEWSEVLGVGPVPHDVGTAHRPKNWWETDQRNYETKVTYDTAPEYDRRIRSIEYYENGNIKKVEYKY
jgi:hypothetical protein